MTAAIRTVRYFRDNRVDRAWVAWDEAGGPIPDVELRRQAHRFAIHPVEAGEQRSCRDDKQCDAFRVTFSEVVSAWL